MDPALYPSSENALEIFMLMVLSYWSLSQNPSSVALPHWCTVRDCNPSVDTQFVFLQSFSDGQFHILGGAEYDPPPK